MFELTPDYIRKQIADSEVIYQRGQRLYNHGGFLCKEADPEQGAFSYEVDGNYGDYTTWIKLSKAGVETKCDCPYPNDGCKHTVAVLLDVRDRLQGWKGLKAAVAGGPIKPDERFLTHEEIRAQALEDRRKKARQEKFNFVVGDMYKGEHLVETPKARQYVVTLHDPEKGLGHCSCPDFATNRLGTCKHMLALCTELQGKKNFKKRIQAERFPFVDVYWDSGKRLPRLFHEHAPDKLGPIQPMLREFFDGEGFYAKAELADFLKFMEKTAGHKLLRIQEPVRRQLEEHLMRRELAALPAENLPAMDMLKTRLYPYQEAGVQFCLYKPAALIGDEMGLGKTLQAIVLAILKKHLFHFERVLVVTLASLKEQWKREIERFTDEKAVIVAGSAVQRRRIYETDPHYFKITNYEAVMRDTTIISRGKPDLVILDEAQRIKNFETKTAEAVKRIPRKHALVLTGTPLENKLEDVYSIVQFLDPHLLAPLWSFAADHFMLSREKKGRIMGYRHLDKLHEKLKPLVLRRRKEEVLDDLPDQVENNYYIDLSIEQAEMHAGFARHLMPLLNKKFLTPIDIKRIQELLLCMRRVCDSTYLIDRQTNISPKLKELTGILDELVIQNNRKVVIFSEWTSMTFLIAKQLSLAGIKFVELTGKIPVNKRQALIDEFSTNPECKVFLSTDAGGTGLNLQAADCVINFELPWNPSRLNQRVGRVNRIGQKSRCVNVVNLIAKFSIEEKIMAGLQLKTDLFEGVFDGGTDMVEFSREKRTELLNRLREMMGEDPELPVMEARMQEEIPEDTPHFMNPKALSAEDQPVVYDAEETDPEPAGQAESFAENQSPENRAMLSGAAVLASQPPERVEAVLNSGLQFITGLMEMATGQKITAPEGEGKMIRLNRETGEITMTFKLPGF